MDPEIKKAIEKLREEIGRNVDALQRLDAIEKAATERDADSKGLRAEIEALKTALAERGAQIQQLQQNARVMALQTDPIRDASEGTAMMGMMFREIMADFFRTEIPDRFRGEREAVRAYREKRATLSAGAVTGSYLVPTILETQILDTLEEESELIGLVDFVPGLPGNVDLPTLTGVATLQPKRATVDTAMTASDPTFGQLSIRPDEAYVFFPVDNRLMQMSAVPLGNVCMDIVRTSVARGIANWLLNADGTSSYNSLTGILRETAADYVLSLRSGHTTFLSMDNQDLNAALAKVLKRGRARGSWVMSLYTYGAVEDLNRTGKVPVVTYGQDGAARIKQRPLVIDELMPDEGDENPSTAFAGFGDLKTYLVGLVGGIQMGMSTEYLWGKNQTAFRGVLNLDIKRKPIKTFVTIKTAAA